MTKRAVRYPKYFTCKAWGKFDLTQQDILCTRYDIILTDYQTDKEKIVKIIKKFNIKNLNKGIKTMNKGIDTFTKACDSFDNNIFPKGKKV